MTCIAWSSVAQTIACDSAVQLENGALFNGGTKLTRLPAIGAVVGFAGDTLTSMAALERLVLLKQWDAGAIREALKQGSEEGTEFECLFARFDGSAWYGDHEGLLQPVCESFFAIGSGAPYALGALFLRATPYQAVGAACKYDPNCQQPICVEEL